MKFLVMLLGNSCLCKSFQKFYRKHCIDYRVYLLLDPRFFKEKRHGYHINTIVQVEIQDNYFDCFQL